MKIQRFEGESSRDALRKAQEALGAEAMILQTRTLPGAGAFRRPRVEVLAAIDASPAPPPATRETAPWRSEIVLLRQELDRLRRQVACGGADRAGPPPTELAGRLRSSLQTRAIQLRPGVCTIVALVGPTGVGKTTTLAKLAAAAARAERKRVALVTLDTYRIGAVEQLETYARLLEAPLARAETPADLGAACERYARHDLLLIDTTGRSAFNAAQIAEQAALLQTVRTDEVHLCLDSGASDATLTRAIEGFAPLRPTHLLLTKLDETSSLDASLQVALDSDLPLSYVTTGQRVPEDLALADGPQMAAWVAAGGYPCS